MYVYMHGRVWSRENVAGHVLLHVCRGTFVRGAWIRASTSEAADGAFGSTHATSGILHRNHV